MNFELRLELNGTESIWAEIQTVCYTALAGTLLPVGLKTCNNRTEDHDPKVPLT